MPDRECAWCHGPIGVTLRSDAVCCSVRCRQARHRFLTDVGVARRSPTGESLRLAYADPPYPGMAHLYRDHPDYAGEVDHGALIRRLSSFDGWALSTSARSLPEVLALCPAGVRVAAWHRGERPALAAGPLNGWEPVIFWGGRAYPSREYSGRVAPAAETSRVDGRRVALAGADASHLVDATDEASRAAADDASRRAARRVDSLVFHSRPRLTDPDRVIGSKPATFCRWMFDLLGAEAQDQLEDLFPGSGGVLRAWEAFSA